MTKKITLLTLFVTCTLSFAQVGIGTTTPDPSAALDITDTERGLLVPRMTLAERNAIATPANGLLIYQTDNTTGFWFYNGSVWTTFGADTDWTVSGTDMYNANTGNIGVGNTTPTAKFHITGTTVPASSGTTTLYSNDFSSGGVTNTLNAGNGCTASPNIWHIESAPTFGDCTACTGNRAYIQYNFSCVQDQTMTEGNFTPNTTSVDISFNYGYEDYSGTDSFTVTLYNESTATTIATLINLTTDADTSYTGNHTVVAGNNYSLKFQYIGDNDLGVTVDDILVTETSVATPGSYVFRLEDGQEQDGYVLTSDASGNATWKASSGGGGGSGTYSFTNGITEASSTVKLGGTLTEDTTIGATGFALNVSSSGKTNMLYVDDDDDVVKFGHNTTPWDAGSTYTIDTNSTTIEYMTSNYNGTSRGTTTGVGSLEYFVDVEASIASSDNFLPISDDLLNLGSSNNRWMDIYLANAPTVSSDMTLKNNVKELNYGLNTLLELNTISYQWKNDQLRDTRIPNNQKETHLGFSAQQLLEVMPEVVKTHTWKILDETTPGTYTRVKNDKLGVRYSEIIPVTVKAIQEQQEQIEELKNSVTELKKQNELLMKLLEK